MLKNSTKVMSNRSYVKYIYFEIQLEVETVISDFPHLIQEMIEVQRIAKIHSMIQEHKMIVKRISIMITSHESMYEKTLCDCNENSPFRNEEAVDANDLMLCKKTSFLSNYLI